MSLISKRLNIIKPSPTLSITRKAAELKSRGINVISLGAGEPDSDTPDNIKEAAISGIYKGATKYTNVDGTIELKKAIQQKLKRENNLDYDLEEIMVCNGGKQVIYNLFMASLDIGDEVIIPAPYWVSYPDIVALADGKAVIIPCDMENDFKLTAEALADSITSRTKWLIINSPGNPTGSGYSCEDLRKLAVILRANPDIYVMSDDIYEHITFDDFKFCNIAEIAPDLKERIFIVNGVSKAYAMTGWRIGYGAGKKELIKAMTVIQSQSTSNPSSVSQVAAVEALNGPQDFIRRNALKFQRKRDLTISMLKDAGLKCHVPQGAFYLFPECGNLFGKKTPTGEVINNSHDMAEYLLEEGKVAVVPGSAFGLEGYFRVSYATSAEEIKEACIRIRNACDKLC